MTEFARTIVLSEKDYQLPIDSSVAIEPIKEVFDENDSDIMIAEKIAERINRLYLQTKRDRFAIGRFYNMADHYGLIETFLPQFINDQVVSYSTMRKYAWVERAVPAQQIVEYTINGDARVANLRELPLSFSHYEKVARFHESPEVLARLLVEAMELKLSIAQFNAHIDSFLSDEGPEADDDAEENENDQELEFIELSVPRFVADKLIALADKVDLTPHEVLVALINLYGEQYLDEFQDEQDDSPPF